MEKNLNVENKTKYNLISYILILVTIFLVLLFTKDLIITSKENQARVSELNNTLEQKNKELQEVNLLKDDIKSWKKDKKELDKYLIKFDENELVDYFYNYANLNPSKVKINSVNITKWTLNEFGFHEWKVDLKVIFSDENAMLDMLNYLNNSEKYKLFVHEFTYPMSTTTQAFSVTLPIKVLYK